MARRTVNITLSASGGNQVAAEFGKAGKASTDLIVNIKKIGNVFGEVGGHLGGFVQNLLKGGIWGIAQAAIGGVVSLCQKWRDSAKEAAEAAEKAAQRARDAHQSYIDNYMAAVKKAPSQVPSFPFSPAARYSCRYFSRSKSSGEPPESVSPRALQSSQESS